MHSQFGDVVTEANNSKSRVFGVARAFAVLCSVLFMFSSPGTAHAADSQNSIIVSVQNQSNSNGVSEKKPVVVAPSVAAPKENKERDRKKRVAPHKGREFDRKSGTGRTDGLKKEVAGKSTWGDPVTAGEEGEKVKEELADVLAYAILIGHHYDLDLEQVVREKVQRNGEKYPVEKAKGIATKYNEL